MATTALDQHHAHAAGHAEKTGLWSWLTTVDHKRIGILYGATAFFFFLLGGLEALLIRIQLSRADNTFLDPDTYNQLFTMHGTTMIFLAIMPLSAMFFNYMIPLLIGARDVAFPRLNAFSYWVFLLGGLFLNASFLFGAAPDTGWYGYANLTSRQFSPGPNVDFWNMGLQILGVASLAAAVNFFVTIVNMRAPGMTMMRMPMFVWMSFITQILLLLAFPVITVALILLMFDRFFGTHFFIPAGGGDPLLWQHFFWIFGHPEVYILILPAFGIVSEVLPVFSRKPLFGYAAMVFSGVFIAFLGFGVWSHHMFTTGMGPIADTFFSLSTMLIAIPTGVKIFNWMGTMWFGSLQFKTPMYFAVGFIAMFIIGGLSGVMHSSPPADLQQNDTYFIVAHFHYVLFGGSIFALTAGRLLLVAQDVRADARRGARQAALLAHADRVQPDLLPDAHRRAERHAAPDVHLSEGARLRAAEPDRDGGRASSSGSRSWCSWSTSSRRPASRGTRRPIPGTAPRSSGRSRRRRRSGISPGCRPWTAATRCGKRSGAVAARCRSRTRARAPGSTCPTPRTGRWSPRSGWRRSSPRS